MQCPKVLGYWTSKQVLHIRTYQAYKGKSWSKLCVCLTKAKWQRRILLRWRATEDSYMYMYVLESPFECSPLKVKKKDFTCYVSEWWNRAWFAKSPVMGYYTGGTCSYTVTGSGLKLEPPPIITPNPTNVRKHAGGAGYGSREGLHLIIIYVARAHAQGV